MNKQEYDILRFLNKKENYNLTQRELSDLIGYSVGNINNSIKSLNKLGYLDINNVTDKGKELINKNKPKNAIILAAGIGMRMVPINLKYPKGLLKVHDEYLIERLISQLHEVGIKEIYIVVGYLKEKYEYLIDKYNVKLIVNRDYAIKGSISSLKLASKYIGNSYILPCDIWCKKNPFNKNEINSWYLVNNIISNRTEVRVNRKGQLVKIEQNETGNKMLGIAYLNKEDSEFIKNKLVDFEINEEDLNWEKILYENNRMICYSRIFDKEDAVSINTYEELRDLDEKSENLESYALSIIKETLNASSKDIKDIKCLKKGMTNRSFMFSCKDSKYIMRIPGEGTDHLINRKQEARVYNLINGKNLCDDIIYINEDNGYKITKFIENARVCNPYNINDLKKCIGFLKKFHNMKLVVEHEFDIFEKINYYEQLWGENISAYDDYELTKEKVFSLQKFIEENVEYKCLTHIDAVPDNFLISKNKEGKEFINLIDWEYSAMQDPHVDIAMFAIYALYDKKEIDKLIDIYFENKCNDKTRIKIYCYIASCGLLWSNWCEYKRNLGVEFGEYSLKQYRYAKDFYNYAKEKMNDISEKGDN